MTLLEIDRLNVSLGRKQVIRDLSFKVSPGEFVGFIGPNGAGKSTLLRAILGLVPARGEVVIGGRKAVSLGATQRARKVAYLAQEREVAWAVPVEMLVALGRTPYRPTFAALTDTDRRAIDQAMTRMELEDFRDRAATELSGGEKARVLIARALAQETPLLLADEPTAGLDPSHQIGLMRLFAELAAEGKSVIASLHDLGLAARWCSRLLLIDGGAVIADGPPAHVLTPERLREVYAVEAFFGSSHGRPIVHPLDLSISADDKQGGSR